MYFEGIQERLFCQGSPNISFASSISESIWEPMKVQEGQTVHIIVPGYDPEFELHNHIDYARQMCFSVLGS